MRGKFYWADGRVDVYDVPDTTGDQHILTAPDGSFHYFRATNELEDGCDVYREEESPDA